VVGPVVRTRDLVKVKGMLINPAALLDALQSIADVDEFQVVVGRSDPQDPLSMDELQIRVATRVDNREALATTVAERTQHVSRVRPRVVFAAAKEIYDPGSQTKAKRFVDTR
jgi:phenylacetate-coenzyme A ligase PaaK-like adenylate-forming protein